MNARKAKVTFTTEQRLDYAKLMVNEDYTNFLCFASFYKKLRVHRQKFSLLKYKALKIRGLR